MEKTVSHDENGPVKRVLGASGRTPAGLSAWFLNSVLDSAAECIKVVDNSGALVYMNRNGMCAMEIDDFAMVGGKQWHELWPAETQDMVSESVRRCIDGETVRFEARCPTAKGTQKWWEVSLSPIRDVDDGVSCLVSVSRDITQRVDAAGVDLAA